MFVGVSQLGSYEFYVFFNDHGLMPFSRLQSIQLWYAQVGKKIVTNNYLLCNLCYLFLLKFNQIFKGKEIFSLAKAVVMFIVETGYDDAFFKKIFTDATPHQYNSSLEFFFIYAVFILIKENNV